MTPKRLKLHVNGIVQGVGFRPYVYGLAQKLHLSGFVTNTINGVEIEIEGAEDNARHFVNNLVIGPPLAEVQTIAEKSIPPLYSRTFEIHASPEQSGNRTLISPDTGICEDCRRELFDPFNRRHLYPFINCTNCGPRLTIIENIPYDRKHTTMHAFHMCPECKKEYDNPLDRRFHAQPNACSNCGPQAWAEIIKEGKITKTLNWISTAVEFLLDGKIVAIKGLGGFHLAVDATNERAVRRLRVQKNRKAKPLALMLADMESVHKIANISSAEAACLHSTEKPILLVRKKKNIDVAKSVAPGNHRIGIMLPYTPLHYILFYGLKKALPKDSLPALVMTSGNISEEPIAISNSDARERLNSIADAFVMHDRDILIRADDSVAIFINNKKRIQRRSRGCVPKPIELPTELPSVLALGAELKNTICLIKNKNAFTSQHIGELTNYAAYRFFNETILHLQKIMHHQAEYLACDLHPGYLSTQWARQQSLPVYAIQHHHAHMASCMAEHHLTEPVIGIVWDGTGYGYDRTSWGGEAFVGDYLNLERVAHLQTVSMPGGDSTAKAPWKMALSYLHYAFDGELPDLPFAFQQYPCEKIVRMLEKKINSPLTSSMGRLFDAVSTLTGGPTEISYEAQAAIDLMHEVQSTDVEPYDYEVSVWDAKLTIHLQKLIASIYTDVLHITDRAVIAAKFHRTIADMILTTALYARTRCYLNKIVLSGGVFQNEILLTITEKLLSENGFKVFSHEKIPTNDGGISLGQAVIAGHLIANNMKQPNIEM